MQTILLIDDDEDIRTSIKEALELEGHQVLEAENGKKGLALILNNEIPKNLSLIILDMMMPLMNGEEFLAALQRERPGFDIPVILASAKGSKLDASDIAGCAGRLNKPFNLDDLLSLVEKYSRY